MLKFKTCLISINELYFFSVVLKQLETKTGGNSRDAAPVTLLQAMFWKFQVAVFLIQLKRILALLISMHGFCIKAS